MNMSRPEGVAEAGRYCGARLELWHSIYRHAHGYVSLIVCVFGSIANLLNIAVLTRREMLSPTNAVLTGLAVADLLVMTEYIPFACHMYLPQVGHTLTVLTELRTTLYTSFVPYLCLSYVVGLFHFCVHEL